NYPALARVGIEIVVRQEKLMQRSDTFSQPKLETIAVPKIAILSVFPGMGHDILEAVLEPPLQGLILKTYGAGHIINDPSKHMTLK
ncbi:L-asparaginase 1, partial [Francisella tularensis subsp. holarctica]|nr:L-asparaginase 1 [Francisella tularensis subsp. holarctica]